MKGIIIVNQDIAHNTYKISRLKEESSLLNINLEVVVNDGSLARIIDGDIKCSLLCDFIIYLDKDYYTAKMLERCRYKLFNSADFIKLCDDKILTYIILSNHHISMPKTMSAPLIYRNEINESNLFFLNHVESELGYPLIVKKAYGSLGQGVFLVRDKGELIRIYKEHFSEPLLFQSYIESSKGRSIRVLVIDHKIFGAFERINKDDFRSNFEDGASAKKINLDEKYRLFAENLINLLDIKYAGIDLLYGEDGPVLCEINSNAFFQEFERVTGKNAARAFLEMIKKEMGQE